LLSLLFIPMLVATVTGFVAPESWRVTGLDEVAPSLVGLGFAWIALPLVAGLWLRRWWWGALCMATVLTAAFAWQGGYPVYTSDFILGPSESAAVPVFPTAIAMGFLAAVTGSAGVAWSQREICYVAERLRAWTTTCMVLTPISVFVGLTLGFAMIDTPFGLISYFILLAASTLGAGAAGYWLRHWWWPAVCLFGLGAMALWSGVFYFGSASRYGFDGLGVTVAGGILAVISAVCAGIGVALGRRIDGQSAPKARPRQQL
jgi:hypothetical protein